MIDLVSLWTWPDKDVGDKAMDIPIPDIAVTEERNGWIRPATRNAGLEDCPSAATTALRFYYAFDLAVVADRIIGMALNNLPLLNHYADLIRHVPHALAIDA
jgi:hypothetical protein